MSSVIKGNRPLRIFASMVLILLLVSHFMGQIDLTQISFLWVIVAMAINALQASFTGFCPMFKNSRGECVACGVACDTPECKPVDKKSEQESCCSGTDCCSGDDKKA
ncbi:Inner membrane protein YgaP-like transmembrane domain-containing protein [uncultured Thiomicrorhabdus sp.]